MPSWWPSSLADAVLFTPLRIGFLILLALVVRTVVARMVDRSVRLALASPASGRIRAFTEHVRRMTGGSSEERRRQRVTALGSLVKSVVTVVIVVVTVLIVLTELKFNVTTLVAGTSIVAGAIAFGMQNVIKDLVSGVFILIEDQLGVGDWVRLEGGGEAIGKVVEVGLRITRLRLDDGTVIAVRNGELLRVTNYSQGGPDRPPSPDEPEPEPTEDDGADSPDSETPKS